MQPHVAHEVVALLDLTLAEFAVLDGPLSRKSPIIHQVESRVVNCFHRREIMRELRVVRAVGHDVVAIEWDEDGWPERERVRTFRNSDRVQDGDLLSGIAE